jgi:beta-mannosidase
MIDLNGHRLGNATNQFIRYTFEVSALLNSTGNVLNITFGAEFRFNTGGRYTHSAQIDWAPNMATKDPLDKGRSTFGFGIWKSVYLLPLPTKSAALTQLVPHTYYAGGHPTSILTDTSHAGFNMTVRAELYAAPSSVGTKGVVTIVGDWPNAAVTPPTRQITLVHGINNVTLHIPASETRGAKLWHPRGHGGQPRYNITATFTPIAADADATAAISSSSSTTVRRFGFRDVALVTVNDTDPAVVAAGGKGTGRLTMFFRVNGAAVYARGANKVQMDLMDGRMNAEANRRLVQSAAEGNFNLLRVWGGC